MKTAAEGLKSFVKHRTPRLFALAKLARQQVSEYFPMQDVFETIYEKRGWDHLESFSGPGSSWLQTQAVREQLPPLIKELNVQVLLDAPCGDFYWMGEVGLEIKEYIGVDIVPQLIHRNQERFAKPGRKFLIADITRDKLPCADVALCRDCLFHLSYRAIQAAIRNFAETGSEYLLTTTYPDLCQNINIPTGGWRPLNLQLQPFNFPNPKAIIHEHFQMPDGKVNREKSLGLWQMKDLLRSTVE